MAAKLTLVKGPTLQKLVLFLLLTFSGLGYPPQLCDAIKCKMGDCNLQEDEAGTCKWGPDDDCEQSEQGATHCHWRLDGDDSDPNKHALYKGCHIGESFGAKGDGYFDCMQKELQQHGDCFKASSDKYKTATAACNYPVTQGYTAMEYCKCNADLCNDKGLRYSEEKNGGAGEGGGKGSTGHVLVPGGKVIQVGIIGLMIKRFYFTN